MIGKAEGKSEYLISTTWLLLTVKRKKKNEELESQWEKISGVFIVPSAPLLRSHQYSCQKFLMER